MAKKKKDNQIVKTYSFKTKESAERIENFWKPAIKQYIELYNKVSLWLANNLTIYTLGQVADILRKVKGENKMVTTLSSPEHADLKLYQLFKLKELASSRENVLYEIVKALNIDEYESNTIGFAETYYRNWGYIKTVAGNYASKFSGFKLSLHKRKISSESSFDELTEQYLYEANSKGKTSIAEWKNFIQYIKDNEFSEYYISRIETLVSFYSNNKEAVDLKAEEMLVTKLAEFFKTGCQRTSSKMSMTLNFNGGYSWTHIEGSNDLCLTLSANRRLFTVSVFGHKSIVLNNTLLVDLSKPTQSVCFIIKNGSLFVNASFDVEINKHTPSEAPSNKNTVGIDVNTKHALLFTSLVDDGSINGYVNLYKELLSDVRIIAATKELGLYNTWKAHSQYVTFCPIECDLLLGSYERMADGKENEYAKLGDLVYDRLVALRNSETNVYKQDYITRVIKVRTQARAYLSLHFTKMKLQSEHDKTFSNQEELHKHPFRDTESGIQIISKMRKVQSQLEANRNNIICYAYKLLQNNGFKYIALEWLESAQSERIQSCPTVLSMLNKFDEHNNFVGILGKYSAELEQDERYQKFKDCYVLTFTDGKVSDCSYNAEGWSKFRRSHLNNIIIKAIHFADLKDKFIQLANNGLVQIALDNSQYTSLMDSITNSLYIVEYTGADGKVKSRLAKKSDVRPLQEKHINNLNADYNAACNIRNRITDVELFNRLMKKAVVNKYNTALYEAASKSVDKVIVELKKINRTITIQGTEGVFSSRKSAAKRSKTATC